MDSLLPYLASSLLLSSLGLSHFCFSCIAFLKSPRDFSARTWHPLARLPGRSKTLELYLLVSAFFTAVVYQLIAFSGKEEGIESAHRIWGLQLAAMLVMFLMVSVIILVSETTGALPLPAEASFLLAGIAFAVEWSVMRHKGDPKSGLEAECFGLLATLAAICAGSCLLLALRPKTYLADMVLCAGIILQGTWMMQTGLSLYVESFIPEGCHRLIAVVGGSTQCDLDEAKLRAVALMDLAFIYHAIVVMVVCVFIYGLIAKFMGFRRNGFYDPLEADGESDHLQMKPLSNKVIID